MFFYDNLHYVLARKIDIIKKNWIIHKPDNFIFYIIILKYYRQIFFNKLNLKRDGFEGNLRNNKSLEFLELDIISYFVTL